MGSILSLIQSVITAAKKKEFSLWPILSLGLEFPFLVLNIERLPSL